MLKFRFGVGIASMGLAAVLSAAGTDNALAQSTIEDMPQAKPASGQNKKVVAQQMAPVGVGVTALRAKAIAVSEAIGKMAAQGQIQGDGSAQDLKKLLEELAKLTEQLKKLQGDVEDIQGWIEGQNEGQAVIAGDVAALKQTKWSNYVQFQYNDIQNNTSTPRPNDGFNLRRVRLGVTQQLDSKTSMKVSLDMATGNRRTSAELKDAYLKYEVIPSTDKMGLELMAGQMAIPLGYELERSSSEREMPERSQYNQRLFAGERGRGVYAKFGLSDSLYVHGGLWNSLTVNDPQQQELDTFRNLSGTRPAGHLGLRYHKANMDMGISGFVGTRNDLTFTPTGLPAVTTPTGQRQYIYLDGTYVGLLVPNLTVRGEAMFGQDRVPQFSGSGATRATAMEFSAVRGYQLQASYRFNYRNTLTARWEMYDPNVKADDNITVLGLAYGYMLSPGARLTLAHEIFREQGFDQTNNITTLRVQFKL